MHAVTRVIRGFAAALALAIGVLGMAACSTWLLGSGYTFSQSRLQTALERKFPMHRQWLRLIDVTLANPRLTLLPDVHRVALAVDATLDDPLSGRPLSGTIAVDGELAYDASRHALVLHDPAVREIAFSGLPPAARREIAALGTLVARQWLPDYPIYTFKPEQLIVNGRSYMPGKITILPDGIHVDVVPAGA